MTLDIVNISFMNKYCLMLLFVSRRTHRTLYLICTCDRSVCGWDPCDYASEGQAVAHNACAPSKLTEENIRKILDPTEEFTSDSLDVRSRQVQRYSSGAVC